MRHTREILRLHFESHLAPRQIARICKVAKSTVQRYLERLKAAGLSWPLPADLDDVALERRLFPPPPVASPEQRCLPDCAAIHKELKSRKNVTLQLLWEEYKQANPLGYAYSWYCELYREWQRRLDVVLRQEHRAGEKTFVDYAGQTVPVTDPKTGEVRQAQVFVAVLGASNYTYAEATWTQNLWDWIHSHVRAFEFFEGTSQLVIPDNLKSGVKQPCYYEPELNRTYGDLAIHYGVGILPARPYRPRDKAKAEVGVQIVQRWVLAALRKRQFFSLAELNEAILELVHKLNERPFRKLAGSRAELYQVIDRPALQPLPLAPFVYAEWKKARVNLDYHIELGGHYYSTPYQLVGKEVDVAQHERNGGDLLSGQARGQSCAQQQGACGQHGCGAPAEVAPALSGMDADADHRVGRQGRPVHGAAGGGHPDQQAASGDGLSLCAWRDPAGAQVWRGTSGGGLDAGGAAEAVSLPKREIDVEERPGPRAVAGTGADSVPGAARESAWP